MMSEQSRWNGRSCGYGWRFVLSLILLLVGASLGRASTTTAGWEGWQNRALTWGAGIQSGNSRYAEDQVIPLRWVGTLKCGTTNTLKIRYDSTCPSRGMFVDALGAYNASESGADPLANTGLTGLPILWPLPIDPLQPAGVPRPGNLAAFNASLVEFGSYASGTDGSRSLTVRFKVAGTSGTRVVVLAFGVHLASERVWGVGRGAAQFPGASRKAYTSLNGGAEAKVSINPDAVIRSADLRLAATAPAEAWVGDEIAYDFVVTNSGPSLACSVTISNRLPAGVTFVSATSSVGSCAGSASVIATLGDLPPAAKALLKIRVRLGDAAAGNLVNTATVRSSTADPDLSNNTVSVVTLVKFPDRTPPSLTCPADLRVTAVSGQCARRVDFALQAEDETQLAEVVAEPPSGSEFPLGTTEVKVRATDTSGNSATCVFHVTVEDRTPPVVQCPVDLEVPAAADRCGAVVDFTPPTANDDCSSPVSVTTEPVSGSFFPVGKTTVNVRAVDASGNASECQFLVTVVDRTPPVIECLPDLVVNAAAGACDARVDFTLPGARDACDGVVPVTSDWLPGSTFPIGRTVVTLSATDAAGNPSTCAFAVTVQDEPNDSWPGARPLTLAMDPLASGFLTASVQQCLTRFDQSRWYRFRVQPGSTVAVTLSQLAANYDLLIFKDIAATYQELLAQDDLTLLSAAFASDAFSPAAFSPDALAPAAFSPAAFSPAAFSPAQFSPAAFSPAAFSPAAFSPAAFSPDAFAPAQFSPAQFSPAAFSPAQFSPAAFSPAQFSPAAFSDAQMQSVLGVSAFEGTANEGLLVNTWDSAGDFYVRVRGRNGVFEPGAPFDLRVYLLPGACGDLKFTAVDSVGAELPPPVAVAGDHRTLILTDAARLADDGTLPALGLRLAELAARPEVAGVVVDLGADPTVAFFQAQADAQVTCPTAKNLAAAAIKRVVDAWWQANPNLENLVLVGGDRVVPFFRYPDQSLLGPERNYVPPVRDASASQASLRLNYVLGQDAYGSRCDLPRGAYRLPIAGLSVGRLVERPAEITAVIEAYLETLGGVVTTPSAGLVTGYDFLADVATAIGDELAAGLGRPVDRLIAPMDLPPAQGWNAAALRSVLFGSRHDLIFLAGHFNAFGTLAADFQTQVSATEFATATADFKNTLFVSAGCHSAYNTVDEDSIPLVTPGVDWAQALARRQATLVAGTGYQYGDTDFIEYNERLYLEFFRQLRRGDGPVSVGQALARAKHQYLAATPTLRGLHEKAYLQATLFGLPMLKIQLPAGRGGTLAGGESSIVGATQPFTTNPGLTLGLESAEVQIVPTFSAARQRVLTDFENQQQVTATYFEGDQGILNNPAEPILPLEVRNVSKAGAVLRGVGFREGQYEDLPGIVPLTGAATTEIRGVHAGFPTEVFFPVQPWSVNYFDGLCATGEEVTRLSFAAAQFRANLDGSAAGTLRRFQNARFRLYYSGNLTIYAGEVDSVPGRAGPPSIAAVFASSTETNVHFSTRVVGNPSAGIQEVWVTYTATVGAWAGRWASLNLVQDAADSTLWSADLPLPVGFSAGNLRYVVQAVNGVGLVAFHSRQGNYFIPDFVEGAADADATATAVALVEPPTSASFGSRVSITARLTADGVPVENRNLVFRLGDQLAFATTGTGAQAGLATATLSLTTLPGAYELKVSFPGGPGLAPSWNAAPFEIVRARTTLQLVPTAGVFAGAAGETLTGLLTDASGSPLVERTVLFLLSGTGTNLVRTAITDYAGRAPLGGLSLGTGQYNVRGYFAAVVANLPGSGETLDLTDPRYEPAEGSATLTFDADAPVVSSLTPSPSVLRPADGRMVPVTVTVQATDASGPVVSRILSITSNEPISGLGRWDLSPDWEITGPLTTKLRAERAPKGAGRIYTLTVESVDAVGNRRQDTTWVRVPCLADDDDKYGRR